MKHPLHSVSPEKDDESPERIHSKQTDSEVSEDNIDNQKSTLSNGEIIVGACHQGENFVADDHESAKERLVVIDDSDQNDSADDNSHQSSHAPNQKGPVEEGPAEEQSTTSEVNQEKTYNVLEKDKESPKAGDSTPDITNNIDSTEERCEEEGIQTTDIFENINSPTGNAPVADHSSIRVHNSEDDEEPQKLSGPEKGENQTDKQPDSAGNNSPTSNPPLANSVSAQSGDEDDTKTPSDPNDEIEDSNAAVQQQLPSETQSKISANSSQNNENDSNDTSSENALVGPSSSVARSPRESQAEEIQAGSSFDLDEEIACATNMAEDEEEKEDYDEEQLKMIQSTEENPDTETSFSASGESSDTTVGTEAAGTDTTSDTEDSLSTDENLIMLSDDDEQHLIMPQQPDITHADTNGLAASPHSGAEEEKTEVDEYLAQVPEDNVHLEEILDRTESPPPIPPMDFDGDAHIVPPVIENKRAEYVSIAVLKLEASDPHGLEFMLVDRELRVSCIHPHGLFANSPLAAFDKMLRINDLDVENLDPVNASHILDVLKGSVTVIAQNPGGVADLVESQTTKPIPESLLGIEFTDVCRDDEKKQLEIVRVGEKSLFSTALLHAGDVVVAINNCYDLDMHTGNLLLSTAPSQCVILARTKLKTQMAIARRPKHQLPPGFNIVRAMEEARRQREELRRKQGCYYNSCERPGASANIVQWLGNVYAILIALIMIGRTWRNVKDDKTIDESDTLGILVRFVLLFLGASMLGILVNSPWWFRKVGARFSLAQLICNAILIAGLLVAIIAFGDYLLVGLCVPLFIIVNLPSIFVKREYGGDGGTLSDDNMSFGDHSEDMA